MMRYATPKYRLPREKLTAEIARILDMGVEVRLDTRLDDPMASCEQEGFDALLLAIGARSPRCVELAGDAGVERLDALAVLRAAE